MDMTDASEIINVGYNGWRNFWEPTPSSIKSAEQSLTAGKHYYFKVVHTETSGGDHMTVGFTINDVSQQHANSQKGQKALEINPNHIFEKYQVILPNNIEAKYRLQFKNSNFKCTGVSTSSDVFQCTTEDCPCVSTTFTAESTTDEFRNTIRSYFNSVRSNLGNILSVVKDTLDASGEVTTVEADIASYRFRTTARYVISADSSTETKIYSDTTGVSGTVSLTESSTIPLSGSYRIRIPLENSTTAETVDISPGTAAGHVIRSIYNAAPEYIGKIEMNAVTKKYFSQNEGKELYYRISGHPDVNLEIIDSPESPMTGGSLDLGITLSENNSVKSASNTPFYETIPGHMVRAVETSPQVVVKSNDITGACPTTGT